MENKIIISDILKELGISANVRGYDCLVYAIEMVVNDKSLVYCVTKKNISHNGGTLGDNPDKS